MPKKSPSALTQSQSQVQPPQSQARSQANARAPQQQSRPTSNGNAARANNDCRKVLYEKYRRECREALNSGRNCDLVDQCSPYGVETVRYTNANGQEKPYWPVDVWALPKEAFRAIGPDNIREGRNCMTRAMWSDTARRAELDTCGGPVPTILGMEPGKPKPITNAATAAQQHSNGNAPRNANSNSKSVSKKADDGAGGFFDIGRAVAAAKKKATAAIKKKSKASTAKRPTSAAGKRKTPTTSSSTAGRKKPSATRRRSSSPARR